MIHLDRAHDDGTSSRRDVRRFVPSKFGDRTVAAFRQQIRRAPRHDRSRFTADGAQRRAIEMIEVRVRDQNEIDLRQLMPCQRTLHKAQRSQCSQSEVDADASVEDGIGQDPHAIEIHEDGGVSEPRECHRVVGPGVGSWPMGSRWNRSTDFLETLPKKPGSPCGRCDLVWPHVSSASPRLLSMTRARDAPFRRRLTRSSTS